MQKILMRFFPLSFSLLIISCTPDQNNNKNHRFIFIDNHLNQTVDQNNQKIKQTNSSTSPAIKPLHLGSSQWPGYAPWQLAEEKDIFAENNLNVDLHFADYSQSLNSMSKGELDVNNQTLGDTITALANNPQSEQVVIAYLDYSNGADQIIVSREINNLSDLKGKKVAVELGTTTHLLLLLGLQQAGIDPNQITIVNLSLRAGVASFIEEEVEAIATFAPFSNLALKRPNSKKILTSASFPGLIADVLVTNRKTIRERPKELQALVDSWFATRQYMEINTYNSDAILAEQMGLEIKEFQQDKSGLQFLTREENQQAFQAGDNFLSLPNTAQKIADFLLANRAIKSIPNLNILFDDQFVINQKNRSSY